MWLKFTPVFKSGYGTVGYAELTDRHLIGENAKDWLDDLKNEIRIEYGDPEGFRDPIWEIVDIPPKDFLQQKLQEAEELVAYHTRELVRLRELIKDKYHD